jgi:hypothetical protein
MKIPEKYKVKSIDSYLCYDWLLNKHYAKRLCSITYSFGLYNENLILQGICTFGMPPSSTLAESICGKEYKDIVIELNRLVVNDNLEKNVLSFFVSSCLNMLPKPNIIVSFSDANMGHNGYIYQACNFLYTGKSSNITKLIDKDGKEFHFRNIGHLQKKMKAEINIAKRIIECLSDDLLKKEYINVIDKNKYTGHCYVATECYYYLHYQKFSVYHIKHENSTHWFLKDENNSVIDLTAAQFKTDVPYEQAKRGFFLTNKPSKRTQILIDRVMNKDFKIVKKRINEKYIDAVEVAEYLRKYKGNFKAKDLDKIFGYKDTCSHWFRTDSGFSFPNVDDWLMLKDILKLDNSLDDKMLPFEMIPDSKEIISKLELKKIDILPKHRYVIVNANKKDKKIIMSKLKLEIKQYPKGENKNYDSNYAPVIQTQLF